LLSLFPSLPLLSESAVKPATSTIHNTRNDMHGGISTINIK